MLFLDASHHHAKMAGFDDDADALGFDHLLDGFGDLGGEALLYLEAAGEEFDEARNFAEADYFAVGDVGDVHFAEEREQVVLAEAEHFDVFDDDHFVVGDGKERALEQGVGVFGVSAREELQGFADALGCVLETFALWILAETHEHLLDEVFEAGAGEAGGFGGWFHGHINSLGQRVIGHCAIKNLSACVFEGIHHSLFEAHSFQMREMEAALHYFVNLNAEIFGGRDLLGEFRQHVQVLVAVAGEHFAFDEAIEIGEVADHASFLVDWAADCYFDGVVVAVAIAIITFAVGALIFFCRHRFAVEAVRGGEEVAAGEVGFHIQLLASSS